MGPIYGRDYRKHDWMKNISSAFDIWGEHKARQELEARQALADARAARAESRAVALNNARLKGLGQKYSINEWEFEQAQKTAEDERNKANYLLTKEGQDTALRVGGLGEYDRVSHPFSLAPEGSITKTLPSDPASLQSFPTSYENLIAPISAKDQSIAESTLASKGSQEVFQNINYIRRGLQINEDRIIAANAAGDASEMARLQREQQQLKIIEQKLKNKLSESTYGSKVSKSKSDAFKAADQRSMQALKLERERQADQEVAQLKAYKDVAGGFHQFPAAQTMATGEYEEDPYDVRPPTEAEKAYARSQIVRLGSGDKVGDLEAQQLGLAPVVRGDIQWVNDPNNKQTYAQNVTKTSEWLATIMRGIAEEANDKTDNGLVIPSITENEEKRIINSVVMASVQIARTTGKRVEDIVQLILANKKLYLNDEYKEDKSGFDEYYYDYIPKGYDEIITAFDQKYKHIKDTGRAPITTEAAPQEVPSLDSIAVIMGNGRKITYRELQEEARYQSNVQKRKVSMKEVLEQLKKQDGINQNTILPSTTLPNRLPSG